MSTTPMQAPRPETHGSRTMTITPTEEAGPSSVSPPGSREGTPNSVGVIRLRGGPVRRQRVMWTTDTVDNEGMGKKKSKICCIYHKPRRYDESSSESESDSDDGPCCDDTGAGHAHAHRARQPMGTELQEESSDESDGGAGDGRARPARKPRQKAHKHEPKSNKYDAQPKGKGKE